MSSYPLSVFLVPARQLVNGAIVRSVLFPKYFLQSLSSFLIGKPLAARLALVLLFSARISVFLSMVILAKWADFSVFLWAILIFC